MNIEAIHTGDNPVKVTKPMMNNLNKFNTRQLQIEELNTQINAVNDDIKRLETEMVSLSSSEDKKANKELKSVEKELNSLHSKLEKMTNEIDKLKNIKAQIVTNLPNITFDPKENNSLTNELNDISFDMPTVQEDTPMQINEPVEENEKNTTFENDETSTEVNWPEFNYMPEMEEIPRRIPEIESAKEEYNAPKEIEEVPIVPVDNVKEPAKLNESSINIIDNLINPKEETTEIEEEIKEPEIVPIEEIKEPKIVPVEETKEEVKEEPVEDDMPVMEEVTLKDYIKFPNYQAWLFTFAEDVYGKENFTKKEILDLENKDNFISERRFNSGRAKQAIALTNENNKLIEKTQQAIVTRNASQTLAKNLTNELNDTKNKLDDLTSKYDAQSTKLKNTEKTLEDTRKELSSTKEELEKTIKELEEYKSTFNKMRGIMETSGTKKTEKTTKKSKEQK